MWQRTTFCYTLLCAFHTWPFKSWPKTIEWRDWRQHYTFLCTFARRLSRTALTANSLTLASSEKKTKNQMNIIESKFQCNLFGVSHLMLWIYWRHPNLGHTRDYILSDLQKVGENDWKMLCGSFYSSEYLVFWRDFCFDEKRIFSLLILLQMSVLLWPLRNPAIYLILAYLLFMWCWKISRLNNGNNSECKFPAQNLRIEVGLFRRRNK